MVFLTLRGVLVGKHEKTGYLIREDGAVLVTAQHSSSPHWVYGSNKGGYRSITLKDKKHYYIHRLVAETFIPNPFHKPFVDHKDRNRSNNTASNLHWVTASENQINRATHDLCKNRYGVTPCENLPLYKKEYDKSRKDHRNAIRRKNYASDPEKYRKLTAEWKSSHPERWKEIHFKANRKYRNKTNIA